MLQRLGIRGKLLMVVAVPTLVLLLATVFVVWTANSDLSTARNSAQLIDLVGDSAPLIENLQAERAAASSYLRTVDDGEAKVITSRAGVNTTLASLRNLAADDPALAGFADQVAAIIAGNGTDAGLEAARVVGTVDVSGTEFPVWPTAEDAAKAQADYERMAAAVTEIIPLVPAGEFQSDLISLPELLRTEGESTVALVTDGAKYSGELPGLFNASISAASTFGTASRGIADRPENQTVIAVGVDVARQLEELEALRARVTGGSILPRAAELQYTALITDLLTMNRNVANSVSDRQLAAYLGAYVSLEEVFESTRSEEVYVARKVREGYWVAGEITQYQALYFGTNNALDAARLTVEPLTDITPVPEFGASYSATEVSGFETIRNRIVEDGTVDALADQRSAGWEQQVAEELEVMAPIRAEIIDKVESDTSALVRSSVVQLIATVIVALIVFIVSQLITQAIARRIINPLRRLTTTATAVRQELPRLVERVAMPGQTVDVSEVQIPVESNDEVGRLAEAFNSVNAATLSIAAEQAALRGSISEMFVNVARRDQVLLNRQLASIDEMERTEDNQETLTKLFALDHLATRMRRNSESLLVLAGIDTGRRLRRPMPLSDVIRTASSEIELYERVQLELDADPAMLGHSALTAAHLFAELLENATVFSDPGTQVVVRTTERDGAFVVSVIDSGIGMTPSELAEANSRVASTAASEILGAQRLGLFVVGRIARRVGARVHLESAEGKGTEATVVMPPSLFDASLGYSAGHVSSSTADTNLHAPAALVHHSASVEETPAPAPRGVSAYQPTVIEQGTSLSGRAPDAPEVEAAPLVARAPQSQAIPVAAPAATPQNDIDSLMAADAAAAPAAQQVDLGELTEGVTAVGLPTRRRRGPAGPESPQDTSSIIALPQRASDAQLSALQSAATTGFTPILAADEVSPESAEARSRVFRGFRPLRGHEAEAVELAPDAESLGHAVRRGASATEPVLAPEPTPDLAPDTPAAVPVVSETASETATEAVKPEGFEPAATSEDRSYDVMRNFAVEAADPRDERAPIIRQSPLITTGYVDDNSAPSGSAGEGAQPPVEMLVPQLVEDDEPLAVAPSARERFAPVERIYEARSQEPSAGVESVSLDDLISEPQPRETAPPVTPAVAPKPQASPYAAQVPESLVGDSHVSRAPLYPAATDEWRSRESHDVQFESDPVTSVPSLDDLILDGSSASHADARGGFFSRLFGKGGKGADQGSTYAAPASAPTPVVRPVGPATGPTLSPPSPAWAVPAPEPVRREEPPTIQPQPEAFNPPPATVEPTWASEPQRQGQAEPRGEFAPSGAIDQFRPMAVEPEPEATHRYVEPVAPTPVESFDRYAQPAPQPAAESFDRYAQPAPQASAEPADRYANPLHPGSGADVEEAPQWTTLPPAFSVAQPQYGEPAPYGFPPNGPSQPNFAEFTGGNRQAAAPAHALDHAATVYSPDQLARPLGWETAGASALQAAAPEKATEYRPVVQITPQDNGPGEQDFASAVFSELSSLAAERPKVEKTSAGLQKRTPVAREPQPIEPIQSVAAAPRDAEAVRSRFSAFYSGTQRARDDAQNFNDSTQGSLTES